MTIHINNLRDLQNIPEEERHFVYIPEHLSAAYPVADCGEELVDLSVFFAHKKLPILIRPVAKEARGILRLREGAAARLARAAERLSEKTGGKAVLLVTDAHRPISLQRKYFEEISRDIAAREGLEGRALWERVTQFIADPELTPPHTTGGAIDLTIADAQNQTPWDMGTPVDCVDDRSNTWSDALHSAVKGRRNMLWECMTSAGFVNLPTEWWHYSYGDQYWAIMTGERAAKYGSVS